MFSLLLSMCEDRCLLSSLLKRDKDLICPPFLLFLSIFFPSENGAFQLWKHIKIKLGALLKIQMCETLTRPITSGSPETGMLPGVWFKSYPGDSNRQPTLRTTGLLGEELHFKSAVND